MADEMDDDGGINTEDVQAALKECVESVLEQEEWDESKVPQWIDEICERAMQSLFQMQRPYKYIVTCACVQKTDKPIVNTFSTNWENNADIIEYYQWPAPRNKDFYSKTISCFLTVMALKF